MKKLLVLISVSILTMMPLTGCDRFSRYNDANPELHIIAINSLLGTSSNLHNKIIILEEDSFGRVMFAFLGGSSNGMTLALLISQKTTKTDSYFYDGVNYILCGTNEYVKDKDAALQYFSDEQLENFKQNNDWNKEINEQKLFKVKIVRERNLNFISTSKQRKAFEQVSDDFHVGYVTPLAKDKNGKFIYYMRGNKLDKKTNKYIYTNSYVFMFDENENLIENTGIMEITDLWNYQKQLKEFKELNGWSFYYL